MESLTRNQQFALASALIYFVAGAAGFVVTGFDDFAADTDEKLIILGLNPLHNVVHFVLGAAWLVGARTAASARLVNVALGVGLLVAFVLGVAGGATFLNTDNAAEPDNYLHLVYGLLSVFVGTKVADEVAHTPAMGAA